MDPLDLLLADLAAIEVPDRVAMLDHGVVTAIRRHATERRHARITAAIAIPAALAVGVVSNGLVSPSSAPSAFAPLALAPSTLLADG